MRVFTIFPPMIQKSIYCPELRELLPDGTIKLYTDFESEDDDPFVKLFEEQDTSTLRNTARVTRGGRNLTPAEKKKASEFKLKLFDCVRQVAKIPQEEQFWILNTGEVTPCIFSGPEVS